MLLPPLRNSIATKTALCITVAIPELGRWVVGSSVGGGQVGPERRRSGAGNRLVTRCVVFYYRKRKKGADITHFVFYDFLFFKNEIAVVENPRQITHLHGDLSQQDI